MNMSRRERRQNGLLAWQLALRTVDLYREGADVANMSKEELAAALAADLLEAGLCKGFDIDKLMEWILKVLPYVLQIVQIIITLL